MFDELRATPEVLYGAVIAFVIVVLLTPGRRRNGADARRGRPARRAPDQPPADPAPRRARDLPRDPRPVARVPRPLGREPGRPARRGDRDGRRRRRRLPRALAVGQARRPVRRRVDPVRVRRLDRPRHVPVPRRRRPPGVDRRPRLDALHRRRHEHGQLPRRDGRARGRRVRHRRRDVRDPRALAREARPGDPLGDRRRLVPRVPPPQLLPGADLHGRLRRALPRVHPRGGVDPGPAEDRVDRRPPAAAARPRGADHRHLVRRRAAAEAQPADLHGRPQPPPPPLPQHRVLAATGGGDHVALVREPRGRGARDAIRAVPRRRRVASAGRRSSSSRSGSSRSRSRSTSCTCSRS